MNLLQEFFKQELWGNPAWLWAASALAFLVSVPALFVARAVVVRRLRARAEAAPGGLAEGAAEVLDRTWKLVLLFAGLFVATRLPALPTGLEEALVKTFVVAALIQAGVWATALLSHWIRSRIEAQKREAAGAAASTAVILLSFGGKLAVWSVVVLSSLDSLGVDVTALIAGLGIGGVAVALAAQNVLSDLFASVSIALDRPFEIGDFIIVGDFLGTVEYIGLKTTRVRSLWGEQLVFSNADLLGSRVRNFKRMRERRVVFSIGVTYQTPHAKLEAIPGMLRETVEAQADVRFDRAHLFEFGDSALIFEVVYYVLSPDYNLYMDRRQAINLEIHRRFEKGKIEFAYPTQTIHLAGETK